MHSCAGKHLYIVQQKCYILHVFYKKHMHDRVVLAKNVYTVEQ